MVARVQPTLQHLPALGREQVAAHGRNAQVGGMQGNEVVTGCLAGFAVLPRAHRAGKGLLDVAVAQGLAGNQAGPDQCLPVHGRIDLGPDARHPLRVAALGIAHFGPRHLQRCGQQALVQDAHRRRRLGHPVKVDIGTTGFCLVVEVGADLDALHQRDALVLFDEASHRLLAQPFQEHRLVVRQHAHVREEALGIERDQQVEGRAGKAGNRCHVDRLEHVGNDGRGGSVLLEDWPDGQLTVFFAHDERRRKSLEHGVTRHRSRLRGPPGAQREKQQDEGRRGKRPEPGGPVKKEPHQVFPTQEHM